ncbi:hypothetical protein GCM10017083_40760 [Thalassobaculum fulvum]|uniref:Uncharacterized protein n=1 Tax=Thalassobaculum fulvum TaxID=1633335 RepID=A0A918XUW8_9PROT|nr:hypothetical protein [Thalassobaculum fulvum]GHD58183.1 hypothetical protein GCM10017083_40760 [Thalassobaculum fulvum]
MAAIAVFLVLSALVLLAVRVTRRQMALSALTDALAPARRSLVAVDPASGRVLDARAELAEVEATWHPVRFPEGWESRGSGFPPERASFDRTLGGRRKWCETRCRGAWRVERPESGNPVFWFEDRRDAADFSLQWFPFKCS